MRDLHILNSRPTAFHLGLRNVAYDAIWTRRAFRRMKLRRWQCDDLAADHRAFVVEILRSLKTQSLDWLVAARSQFVVARAAIDDRANCCR